MRAAPPQSAPPPSPSFPRPAPILPPFFFLLVRFFFFLLPCSRAEQLGRRSRSGPFPDPAAAASGVPQPTTTPLPTPACIRAVLLKTHDELLADYVLLRPRPRLLCPRQASGRALRLHRVRSPRPPQVHAGRTRRRYTQVAVASARPPALPRPLAQAGAGTRRSRSPRPLACWLSATACTRCVRCAACLVLCLGRTPSASSPVILMPASGLMHASDFYR